MKAREKRKILNNITTKREPNIKWFRMNTHVILHLK